MSDYQAINILSYYEIFKKTCNGFNRNRFNNSRIKMIYLLFSGRNKQKGNFGFA